MKNLSKVLVFVLAFVSFVSFESKAQGEKGASGNGCSAKGLFGDCAIFCGQGQRPMCSGGFFASCSCEGMYLLNKIAPNQENINEFITLVVSFESMQGKELRKFFTQTLELMKGTDGKAYSESVSSFEKSLTNLPKSEKAIVDAWVTKRTTK